MVTHSRSILRGWTLHNNCDLLICFCAFLSIFSWCMLVVQMQWWMFEVMPVYITYLLLIEYQTHACNSAGCYVIPWDLARMIFEAFLIIDLYRKIPRKMPYLRLSSSLQLRSWLTRPSISKRRWGWSARRSSSTVKLCLRSSSPRWSRTRLTPLKSLTTVSIKRHLSQ